MIHEGLLNARASYSPNDVAPPAPISADFLTRCMGNSLHAITLLAVYTFPFVNRERKRKFFIYNEAYRIYTRIVVVENILMLSLILLISHNERSFVYMLGRCLYDTCFEIIRKRLLHACNYIKRVSFSYVSLQEFIVLAELRCWAVFYSFFFFVCSRMRYLRSLSFLFLVYSDTYNFVILHLLGCGRVLLSEFILSRVRNRFLIALKLFCIYFLE